MSKATRESPQIPLKLFNVMGASELRHNRALIIVIAISVILSIVIAALAKIISDQSATIRQLQDSRIMYGFPNSEGVFVSSRVIPEHHIKGFTTTFIDNFFNYTPESSVTNATEALRMMSSRLRALQEEKVRTTAKAAYEQQITQVFTKSAPYKIEPYKDLGYLVTFPAQRHRVVLNSVFNQKKFVIKLLLKPVKPSAHYQWALVLDDFQIEEVN